MIGAIEWVCAANEFCFYRLSIGELSLARFDGGDSAFANRV
jgi:hypothetical protein